MKLSSEELHAIREQVLQHCHKNIKWYGKTTKSQRRLHYLLQSGVSILSSVTLILILIEQIPKPLQALPAALVGMLAAIAGVFHISESYARFAYTAEALKSEKHKFKIRIPKDYRADVDAADTDEYKALERFVVRVEELVMNEVTDWRQFVQSHKQDGV